MTIRVRLRSETLNQYKKISIGISELTMAVTQSIDRNSEKTNSIIEYLESMRSTGSYVSIRKIARTAGVKRKKAHATCMNSSSVCQADMYACGSGKTHSSLFRMK